MDNLARLAAEPENVTVVGAIRQASARSGVDFTYLLQQAATESSLNPSAQASTSSASGLYQFIDQTWLQEMAQHGAEYGLSKQAAAISVDGDGHANVTDPAMRRQIIAMKDDPTVAAEMAASFTKDNQEALQAAGVGKVGSTELYLAHFLGAGGAAKFLTAMKSNAGQNGAAVLPQAADANEPIFFRADGSARSLGEIYSRFAAKFDGTNAVTASSVASATLSASASAAYANTAKFASSYTPTLGTGDVAQWGLGAGTMGGTSLYEMMVLSQLRSINPTPEKKAEQTADQSL